MVTSAAEDCARTYFTQNFKDKGLPDIIISDRDSKFLSEFWTTLSLHARTELSFTTAHHSQAGG